MHRNTLRRHLVAIAAAAVLPGVAPADPPQANDLGAVFRVVSKGTTSTVEIRLTPRTAFEAVRVEAASGVASITPPCAFAQVEAGGSYVCRVDVVPKAGESSLTLNVVGEKGEAGKARVVEVRHFTLGTGQPGKVNAAAAKPVPGLALIPGQGSAK
jgi:hypothetical protein